MDLATIREEFLLAEPSTSAIDAIEDSAEELEEGLVEPQQDDATF